MKTTVTATVDAELITEARLKKINISQLLNNTLKVTLEMADDTEEVLALEDKIIHVKARLMSLESEKEKIKEVKEKAETERRRNVIRKE